MLSFKIWLERYVVDYHDDMVRHLFEIMKKIPFDDNKLRQLTTPPEGKSKEKNIKEVEFYDYQKIREIKTIVGDKEYQLDRDNIGWLFNFVYFYYAENISLEDLTNLYQQLKLEL